ncbi:MAG TPA: hypothetical protein VGJ55_00845 [Pyrinomonadaceae bacterium]
MMKKFSGIALSIFFAALVVAAAQYAVLAQSAGQSPGASVAVIKEDETNLDTQLYLIVATNQSVQDHKIPVALEPIIKQLRESLPFTNYSVAATLLNRVKDGTHLNLRWIGGPLLAPAASTASTPSFNEFTVSGIKIVTDQMGRNVIRVNGFSFGSRVPIQTQATVASAAAPSGAIVSYEPTGLHTDISMHEGEPVVVGTLNVGPSGDALVIIFSAKRAPR